MLFFFTNLGFMEFQARYLAFFLLRLLCILYKSTTRPSMEYCCHVWAGVPSCYLDLLDKLQKWICRAVGLLFAVSLEPLAHCWNVASLSLFYRYYFSRCSSKLAQLVSLPYSRERSTHYSDILHDFSVTIPRSCKDIYVNSFFLAQLHSGILCLYNTFLWPMILVALSLEFTSFNCRLFLNRFPICLNLFFASLLATPCFVKAVQPCMEWIPIIIKKI